MVYHNKNILQFSKNIILPPIISWNHLQADNRVVAMPIGPIDMLRKVLGTHIQHVQVLTNPSLATSGQLTMINAVEILHSSLTLAQDCVKLHSSVYGL